MSGLKMPVKGKAALLLSDLNAEHAPSPQQSNDEVTSNVTKLQSYNVTTNEASNVTPARKERLQRGLEIAQQDEIAVVTVRVSARLNEYMDRYVERVNRTQPKRRYRKQDAVAEAFAAFFADHEMPAMPSDEELA